MLLTSGSSVVVVEDTGTGCSQLKARLERIIFVYWSTRTLYAYVHGVTLLSQSCRCSTCNDRVQRILLSCIAPRAHSFVGDTWKSSAAWYEVQRKDFKNLNVNSGLLSSSSVDGIEKSGNQWLKNIVATAVEVVWAVDIALVSFEYWPIITTMNWFPVFTFFNRLRMSMATYFSAPEERTGKPFVVCCSCAVFYTQTRISKNVQASFALHGQ